MNVAWELFFHSRVLIQFWRDCVLTATYLINRTPSHLLGNKAPFEILHKQLVDYSHLKVFGCLAFASTLSAHRTKFDPRARICVVLGYPPGMKGYKLYDIISKQVFISRDVVFHEHIFPFHTTTASIDLIDPFPSVVLPNPASDIPSTSPPLNPTTSSTTLPSHLSTSFLSPINPSSSIPSSSTSSQVPTGPIRKSTQSTRFPSYLRDFHYHLSVHPNEPPISDPNTLYPISNYLYYNSLSSLYKNFIMAVSSSFEPRFYHQAVSFPHWRAAMQDELKAMESNHTWLVVPLPPGKYSIGCRWVHKIKHKSDGSIERYKARLVATGYNQQEGIDFIDTFSPVAKLVTVKVLLTLALSQH